MWKTSVCFELDTVKKQGDSAIGYLGNLCSKNRKNDLRLVKKAITYKKPNCLVAVMRS